MTLSVVHILNAVVLLLKDSFQLLVMPLSRCRLVGVIFCDCVRPEVSRFFKVSINRILVLGSLEGQVVRMMRGGGGTVGRSSVRLLGERSLG
jgi:hypothetical protein